jgi:spore coat polysaccharide biosynthesis protein SpsF
MGSSRLPGKVLKKINNISILECQILRLKRSMLIDNIIVATINWKINFSLKST